MHFSVSIAVNKQPSKGAREFLQALPELLKSASTWELEQSTSKKEAKIKSTASMSSLPNPPAFRLVENAAGSVLAVLVDKGWSRDQEAHALEPLIYLCLTSLSSFVANVHIDV